MAHGLLPKTSLSEADAARTLDIGVVTSSISRKAGGLFESVRAGAIGLHKLGHSVSVYGIEDVHADEDAPAWAPVAVRRFRHSGPAAFGYSRALGRALDDSRHDLLHLHGLWMFPSVAVSRWRARTGRPVLISPRGMLDPWALRNSARRKRIARLAFEDRNLRGAACLHALAQAEADAMRAIGLGNPIAIIPNGIHIPDLTQMPARPDWMDERRTLLFLGRIHPKKGLSETLAAWALLKARAPSLFHRWRLAIAGWDDGGHLTGLRQQAEDLGIADDVVFPGPLFGADKAAALRHSDGFILASHSEGLPMSVLEAWAYRLPVFMTDACNLPEGFAAGAAVRIEPEPADIAARLAEHLDGGATGIMAVAGRDLAASRFSWSAIAGEHAALNDWLTGGRPRPDSVRS